MLPQVRPIFTTSTVKSHIAVSVKTAHISMSRNSAHRPQTRNCVSRRRMPAVLGFQETLQNRDYPNTRQLICSLPLVNIFMSETFGVFCLFCSYARAKPKALTAAALDTAAFRRRPFVYEATFPYSQKPTVSTYNVFQNNTLQQTPGDGRGPSTKSHNNS